jgi:AcrR family transcriptional regulator
MTTPATRVDGRTARAERTRDAVVEAFLTLTDEGHLRPTAKQISDRAGVSLRSVFQHFEDLETLFAAAADLQVERLEHLAIVIPPDAPFEERLTQFVQARGTLLETISPVRRSALLGEPFSAEIARRLRWSREMNREEVERVFAAELSHFPDEQRRLVAAALHSGTDWFTWETLRVHSGMSSEDAIKVMSLTIRSLLKKEAP